MTKFPKKLVCNRSKIKHILQSIWNEFIYGGHLSALDASSIVFTSALLLEIKITWDCLLVVYLGMESAYLYNRYKDFKKDFLTNPERTRYLERRIAKAPIIIGMFITAVIGILFYFSSLKVLLFALFLLLMSFLYSKIFKALTTKIPGFKDIFVSLMWGSLVIFLVVYYSLSLETSVFLVFLFVFLRTFLNISFFDIKDIESDKKENLLTLAVVWGEEKLVKFLHLVNICSILLIFLGVYLKVFPTYSLALALTFFYVLYYLRKVKYPQATPSLYYVIADGEFALWGFFILLGRILI